MNTATALGPADWFSLFCQFTLLSLMSISGVIGTAPDMHRYLVDKHGWLTDTQFNTSITLAQAAPGPNVLFVALMGWNVGITSAGGMAAGPRAWMFGLLGMTMTMVGILLPSGVIVYGTAAWIQRNRELRAVRAFKQGMAPIVIGLLIATGFILMRNGIGTGSPWKAGAMVLVTTLVIWRTRIHLLWLLAAGGVLGAFGLV